MIFNDKIFMKYVIMCVFSFCILSSKSYSLFYNRWVPIVPYDSFIFDEGPQKIRLLGEDYVIWKHNNIKLTIKCM